MSCGPPIDEKRNEKRGKTKKKCEMRREKERKTKARKIKERNITITES